MTNKYLVKVASMQDDNRKTNKTFVESSVAGWGGHLAGAVAGGVGLGLLARKSPRVGALAQKTINKAKVLGNKISAKPIGKFLGKHMNGPAGVVGGLAGGFIGEEVANYAAIRRNMGNDKKRQGN